MCAICYLSIPIHWVAHTIDTICIWCRSFLVSHFQTIRKIEKQTQTYSNFELSAYIKERECEKRNTWARMLFSFCSFFSTSFCGLKKLLRITLKTSQIYEWMFFFQIFFALIFKATHWIFSCIFIQFTENNIYIIEICWNHLIFREIFHMKAQTIFILSIACGARFSNCVHKSAG